jgi:predicted nucleotidyltransferase component of viral defense system
VNQFYVDAARLLIQVAPAVFESGVFALKGGTAINLFVRDMPRLSVDLDLVFPDHSLPRDQALAQINEAVRQASASLKNRGFQVRTVTATGAGETKILVRRGNIEIKVEVNFVLRGTVYPVSLASLSSKARDTLQGELEIPMASIADIYGGKLVATLDRQHPATFLT